MLNGKTVVLAVTGSIAAYKMANSLRAALCSTIAATMSATGKWSIR